MIYIGITGKHNKPRRIFAWLLGNMLEEMIIKKNTDIDYSNIYKKLINYYKEYGESVLSSSNMVGIESYGRYIIDQVKLLVGDTFDLGINEYPDLEKYKINLSNFSVSNNDELKDNEITLKDFTIRIGETLKKEFGEDFWVKSSNSWIGKRDSDCKVIIYNDIKTNYEFDLIKQNDGCIIEIITKDKGNKEYNKITNRKPDFSINMDAKIDELFEDDSYGFCDRIYEIASKIYVPI